MAEESWALIVRKRERACRVGSTLALAASLLVTLHARADDGAKPAANAAVDAPAPAAAPTQAPIDEPGAALYEQAYARYAAGDTAGALDLMQKSYEISGKPELLFNLGQLHQELRHCNEARKSYERYLALAQADPRRSEAERQVSELERECPEPAAPSADSARSSDPYFTPMRIAAWSTLGASLVFATSATYFAVRAKHFEHQIDENIRDAQGSGTYTPAEKQLESDGQHAAVLARSLGATSLGLAVVGASFLVFNPDKHDPATHGVSLRWSDESLTATYRGTF